MSYRLPDNFENLIVTGDKRYRLRKLGDNIITGGSGQQTLDGGTGNDVLKGGAGADIFVVTRGQRQRPDPGFLQPKIPFASAATASPRSPGAVDT